MSYAPALLASVTPDVISSASPHVCPFASWRGVTNAAASASAATTADLGIYIPIYLPTPKTFKRAFWYAGTTVTGDVDVGLARMSDNVKLVSTGAVAVGTTVTVNDAALTDQTVLILPDWYWLCISPSETTVNLWCQGGSALYRWMGIRKESAAHPLPATLTPAVWATSEIVPYFGLTSKTFI